MLRTNAKAAPGEGGLRQIHFGSNGPAVNNRTLVAPQESALAQSLTWRKAGSGWRLFSAGGRRFGKVFPDSKYPGMWRSPLSGGRASDMANLSWARTAVLDAAIREIEWEARQQAITTPPNSQQIEGVFPAASSPVRQNGSAYAGVAPGDGDGRHMTRRQRLPDRRASEAFQFQHRGIDYLATISKFSDGRMAEIFIDAKKPGSAIAEHTNDAAVLVSLLLQHGIRAAKIRHSISGPLSTELAKAEGEP